MLEYQGLVETADGLANRWFQPLTHVSEARTPRETAKGGQEVKREKRGLRGLSWHTPRHSLFRARSDKQLAPDHRQVTEGLITTRLERAMTKYHLSEKLQAVRDSLSYEEMNLLCQERIDQVTMVVYQQGIIDGQKKLLEQQRDERERRKVGRGKKEWVTVIYFIRSPSAVKIGMAKNAQRRLTVLQTSHPEPLELVATCQGGRELETEYHRRFADCRIRGEWFSPAPDILAEIERLKV